MINVSGIRIVVRTEIFQTVVCM